MPRNMQLIFDKYSTDKCKDADLILNLTQREIEVLTCSAFGLTSEMCGSVLRISSRTVEIHRINMIRKMGAKNIADAVRIAMTLGVKFIQDLSADADEVTITRMT